MNLNAKLFVKLNYHRLSKQSNYNYDIFQHIYIPNLKNNTFIVIDLH